MKLKRNPLHCIYTSSYDRGLEHLLKIWPDVMKAVPKAHLHVFYGWDLFVKFYSNNPASMAWKAKMDEMMKQPGVTEHGRVSQDELKEWIMKCGIWAYPTHFGEINCISAIKAQAWGAVPVVINYAALETTVQHGIKVNGDIYEPDVRKKYTKELIDILKDPAKQDEIRPSMMTWARNTFNWDKIAIQWSEEFNYDQLDEAMDIIVKKDKKSMIYLPKDLQKKHGMEVT